MDIHKMSLPEIIGNFRARNVIFTSKDGSKKTSFVNEIENEYDNSLDILVYF